MRSPTRRFFFFNDPAPTEIYTLSLHDALPIYAHELQVREQRADVPRLEERQERVPPPAFVPERFAHQPRRRSGTKAGGGDRKSTRLNSSHSQISYAVFCLKKKKNLVTAQRSLP